MKTSSIAFIRAIALSLCFLLPSGFLAIAAEGVVVPDSGDRISEISNEEQAEIEVMKSHQLGVPTTERPLDDQIPVAITVNGIPRTDGTTIYLPLGSAEGDALIPLAEISELLSFAIKVNMGDKTAEGFFISESNTFQLDLNTQEVLVAGKKHSLNKGEVEIQGGDIFVKASSFEEWFGVEITFDATNLVLDINSGQDLPFQERMKRLLNAKKYERTYKYDAIKPENAELAPYKEFSYPSLYLTESLGYIKNKSNKSFLGFSTLQGNQDIGGFEADYVLAGSYNSNREKASEITGARLTFQKRDPLKNLLGPLHAGRISFGDVSFPSIPLFLGGQRGAGVEISSDSRLGSRYASNSEKFILDGDAPVGYDAELYRNGSFVAFQQVGPDGRYSFEDLDLPTGFNNFEIILYGPQGQKTVIKRDVTRGARLLQKGEVHYDFAAGAPKSDFLPIREDTNNDSTPGFSAQGFYGFTNYFTMGASVYSGPQDTTAEPSSRLLNSSSSSSYASAFNPLGRRDEDDSLRSTGAAVSAATSFLGMNLQGQALVADKGRSAYEISSTAKPLGINLGVSHTVYKNFIESDQDLNNKSEATASRRLGRFNLTFRLQDRNYLYREDEFSVENILSFKMFNVSLSNDIIRTYSKDETYDDFEGEITALTDIAGIRFRSALMYDLDQEAPSRLRRLNFSSQKSLSSRESVRVEGSREFDTKINTLNLRYSRDFDKFGLDFDTTANSDQNYTFMVGLRLALQPDQKNNYHLVDPRSGGQAALGMRAFMDDNNNGIFDPGEKPIEDVSFKVSTRSEVAKTDKDGIAYLVNLGEAPLRLSVQTDSVPDIYLAPKFDHRDLIPRRGSTPVIDFPFVKMSEIAGYLTHLRRGLEGVVVRLVSALDGKEVEKTETDSDGYFIFPAVKGGNYKIAFGLPDRDFMSLNVDLDASIEDPEEMKVEASDELAKAADEAAAIKPSASNTGAAQQNLNRLNAPAGDMPNIDDPLSEEDLKELDEKAVEGIITQ